MKNALILHGTLGRPTGNWFQWLKKELKKKGYKVWVPRLPVREKPRISRNVRYILDNKRWKFDKDSVLIGHSSSPMTILGILNELPSDLVVKKCIFVSALTSSDWEPNSELFDYKFDFEKIKRNSCEFILIHSDNDPYVPLQQAKDLSNKLNGKLVVRKGEAHFNLESGPKYKKLPILLQYL